MMRSLAFFALKGGSGKTTTAVNVAAGLAKLGKRVLFVDADPQGSATLVFLRGERPEPPTLEDVLMREADATATIRPTTIDGLDLLPADTGLAATNIALVNEMAREGRLWRALRGPDAAYDFVVADTSPQETLVNINVLNYVQEIYCPLDPGVFSLAGVTILQAIAARVIAECDNATLRIAGLILTRMDNTKQSKDVEAQLRGTFGPLVLATTIPANAAVNDANARFTPVLEWAPRSPGGLAYQDLVGEIVRHGQATAGTGKHRGGQEGPREARAAGGRKRNVRAAG